MIIHNREKKMTQMHWIYLFLGLIYTPSIRYIARETARNAHQAAWLSVLVSMVLFIPLLLILANLMKKFPGMSYHDILCKVFGKGLGKIIVIILILWIITLLGVYKRYAMDKLVSTVYIGTDMRFFCIIVEIIIGIIIAFGISAFARAAKVIFYILLLFFILIIVFSIPNMDLKNLTPVSTLDVVPLMRSSLSVLAVNIHITIMFVFNDLVIIDKKVNQRFWGMALFLLIAQTCIIVASLATFSWSVVEQLNYPFSSLVKTFNGAGVLSGMEVLFISSWSMAEYVLCTVLTYSVPRLLKGLFNLKTPIPMIGVFVVFIFFFGQYISMDIFELLVFSEKVETPMNMIMGFGLPVVLFIVAKIRKIA